MPKPKAVMARKPAAPLPHAVTLVYQQGAGTWVAVCTTCGWESYPETRQSEAANLGHEHEVQSSLRIGRLRGR